MPPYVVLTSIPVTGCTVFPVSCGLAPGLGGMGGIPVALGCRGTGGHQGGEVWGCPPSTPPINRPEQLEGRAGQRELGEGRRFAEPIESWVLVFVLPQTSVILGRSMSSPGSQLAHQSGGEDRPMVSVL